MTLVQWMEMLALNESSLDQKTTFKSCDAYRFYSLLNPSVFSISIFEYVSSIARNIENNPPPPIPKKGDLLVNVIYRYGDPVYEGLRE